MDTNIQWEHLPPSQPSYVERASFDCLACLQTTMSMSGRAVWCGYAMSISNLKTLLTSVRDVNVDSEGIWQEFQWWRASMTRENYQRVPPARLFSQDDKGVTEVFFPTRWIDKKDAHDSYTNEREEDVNRLVDLVSFLQFHEVKIEKEWLRWVSKEAIHPSLDQYEFLYHVIPRLATRRRTRILGDPANIESG